MKNTDQLSMFADDEPQPGLFDSKEIGKAEPPTASSTTSANEEPKRKRKLGRREARAYDSYNRRYTEVVGCLRTNPRTNSVICYDGPEE